MGLDVWRWYDTSTPEPKTSNHPPLFLFFIWINFNRRQPRLKLENVLKSFAWRRGNCGKASHLHVGPKTPVFGARVFFPVWVFFTFIFCLCIYDIVHFFPVSIETQMFVFEFYISARMLRLFACLTRVLVKKVLYNR